MDIKSAIEHFNEILFDDSGKECEQCKNECIQLKEWLEQLQEYHQIGTVEECRAAREKQIPKEPKRVRRKYGKHKWRRSANGEIDTYAWENGYHNGVICEICGKSVCVHCNPDYDKIEDCEDEYFLCPNCGEKHYVQSFYCKCGQSLNWGE